MRKTEGPKFAYEASSKKRFEVSEDKYSRERLQGLVDTYTKLKREIPFFAGLTLAGSLSKGKKLTKEIAPHSDVDVYAFIDSEKYKATIGEYENTHPDFKEFVEYAIKHHAVHFPGHWQTQQDVRPANLKNAVRLWIEKEIRDSLIRSTTADTFSSLKTTVDELTFVSLDPNSKDSILWTITRFEEYMSEVDMTEESMGYEFHYAIAQFFYLDVGGGLNPYKKVFFKHLLTLPKEERERHWGIVARSMQWWERRNKIPESIKPFYSESFDEAVRHYLTQSEISSIK